MKKKLFAILIVLFSTSLILAQQKDTRLLNKGSVFNTDKEFFVTTSNPDVVISKSYPNNDITLTDEELEIIEVLVRDLLADHNKEQEKVFLEKQTKHPDIYNNPEEFFIYLSQYRRQYIPSLNENEEKVVWVICFCKSSEVNNRWKTQTILVKDGGNCYFNLKVNLSKKECFDFKVNGSA
ncbi:hypothetical protein NO995_08330 [Aestuariibaculum sp. M13]|uniref:hypothetical protein n=1 Tax=Aestuariibaculum sp. M13 TaxID=2967132 RepID=UPI002159DD99|nr:hypothetical protein [Aestuariibaculum sp. M13]MCR8667686.1 hypothetical protein [Aestuariibaculum sp. M13]